MSQSRNEISFDGLQAFLRNVGFDQSVAVNNSLALYHRGSGAIVTLMIPADGQTVRAADVLSIAMRLADHGLVDESVLEQMQRGKLPLAS